MKSNNYASVVNSIGLISLLLGVFLTFTSVKNDVDAFEGNKEYATNQYEQGKEQIQNVIDLKNGIGIEELSPQEIASLQTITDSVITNFQTELENDYQTGLEQIKSQMWDDIATSSGKQVSLILLGIALIFVAKGLHSTRANFEE